MAEAGLPEPLFESACGVKSQNCWACSRPMPYVAMLARWLSAACCGKPFPMRPKAPASATSLPRVSFCAVDVSQCVPEKLGGYPFGRCRGASACVPIAATFRSLSYSGGPCPHSCPSTISPSKRNRRWLLTQRTRRRICCNGTRGRTAVQARLSDRCHHPRILGN